MGAEQSSMLKEKSKANHRAGSYFRTKPGKHSKEGSIEVESLYHTKKQKRKGKKGALPLPLVLESKNEQETDDPYEWVSYNNLLSLPGGQQDVEQGDRLKMIKKELDDCVKTIAILQAEIRGGRQPGSGLPRQQPQHEAEVYSYRHAEGVDTDGNGEDTSDEGAYTDYDGQSIFYVNSAEYRDSSRGDNEEENAAMEDVEYDSLPAQISLHTYATPVTDVTLHDTNVDGAQSPSLTGVAEEAQDESGEYAFPPAHPLGCYNQIASDGAMINNQMKTGSAIDNQIQVPMERLTSLSKYEGPLYEQPYADAEDSVEYSRLNTEPQSVCYETSVKDGLCKVQLAANYLVVVPFDSETVGEFCGMMSEDYDGSCSILDTDNCSFNKRIQLSRLKTPFIIQFGEIHNHISTVE